jgi:hypothetical protein
MWIIIVGFGIFGLILAHEIWTTLAANGEKGPFFIGTKDPKIAALNLFYGQDDAHVSYVPVIKDQKGKNTKPGVI